MSAPSYTLPPYEEPHIALSRPPSPVREGPDTPDAFISGVELIVSKLPRTGVQSATHHLRALLGEYTLQHPSDQLVPVHIIPGDERDAVDYVFVSVDPVVTQEPRPDLLERVRRVIESVRGLQAEWKVGKGPDRTRRIHFQADSFTQAEALLPKLSNYLNEKGYPFQCSFVSKAMNWITFDLLDRSSVDRLLTNPPVIDHQTLYPSVPRYVQPIYGLEVGILGLKDVLRAVPVIDQYIHSHYGDVIAASRLALNGDAYCVVFKSWTHTSRFLSDPFTAFDSGFGVSHSVSQALPALLYVLNSNGLPSSDHPAESSSAPVRQLQAQFDLLQQKVNTRARALEALATQQEQVSQQIQDNAQRTVASIAGLSTIISGSVRLQASQSRLEALQSDSRTTQLLLAFAPSDRSAPLMQRLQDIESELSPLNGLRSHMPRTHCLLLNGFSLPSPSLPPHPCRLLHPILLRAASTRAPEPLRTLMLTL